MQLTDTHCHIHTDDYSLPVDEVLARAAKAGITQLYCIGTDVVTSERAVRFAQQHAHCYAAIGIHPHDSLRDEAQLATLQALATESKVVAVGECGLDYFYNHSPPTVQQKVLRAQFELASKYSLPMVFHVREAFEDFWPIFDDYPGIRGAVHSFTDTRSQLETALARGLYIGVNGITTFTKFDWQLENARAIPLDRLLLETDAPFLTPAPFRGTVNEPAHVRRIAEFLVELRQTTLEELASATTRNARQLFLSNT